MRTAFLCLSLAAATAFALVLSEVEGADECVVEKTQAYTHPKLQLTVIAGEVGLPAQGSWQAIPPAPDSALSNVYLIPPPERQLEKRGKMVVLAEKESRIQSGRWMTAEFHWSLAEYAQKHNGVGPSSFDALFESLPKERQYIRDRIKRSPWSEDAAARLEGPFYFLIPDVPMPLDPNTKRVSVKRENAQPIVLELRPYVADGKHWVLLTDGRCERRAIDPELVKKYALAISAVLSAEPGEKPPAETYRYRIAALRRGEPAAAVKVRVRDIATDQEIVCSWDCRNAAAGKADVMTSWSRARIMSWAPMLLQRDATVLRIWASAAKALYRAGDEEAARAPDAGMRAAAERDARLAAEARTRAEAEAAAKAEEARKEAGKAAAGQVAQANPQPSPGNTEAEQRALAEKQAREKAEAERRAAEARKKDEEAKRLAKLQARERAEAARRAGEPELPEIWTDEQGEDRTTNVFNVLGGRAAIRETLQMQMLNARRGAPDEKETIAVDAIKGVEVKSHPFEEMLKGQKGDSLPLADYVPQDRFFVYFAKPAALVGFLDSGNDFIARTGSMLTWSSIDDSLEARYLGRLGLNGKWAREFLRKGVVTEVGVLLPDLFLIDGTEMTVLMRVPMMSIALPMLRLMGVSGLEAGETATVQVAGGGVAYWAAQGNLLVVSTHPDELRRVVQLHKDNGRGGLGQSAEFRYMLLRLPIQKNTVGYAYLSDPFIRNLVGPRTKIAQLRRMRARADLQVLTAGALLYKADGQPGTPTLPKLAELGYVPGALTGRDYVLR